MKNNKKRMSSVVWTIENQHINLKRKNTFLKEFEKRYNGHFGKILNYFKDPVEYNLNVFYCYNYFKIKLF